MTDSPVVSDSPPTNGTAMTGTDLIAAERQRQIDAEGYTAEHDASGHGHYEDALARAAVCYASPPYHRMRNSWEDHPFYWPWSPDSWKPTPDDRVRELVKAGALIAAEIDRLQARG